MPPTFKAHKKTQLGAIYTPAGLAEWVASEALLYVMQKGKSVFACDPACGEGDLLLALDSVKPHSKSIGFDIDAEALIRAKERSSKEALFIEANSVIPSFGDSIYKHWNKLL